ncbi:hypothetical protein GCK32_020422 [Trichostrongylus colubriformis]|uniref:Uncharacterized protein n=1 Tax=Trichostrongylus colubriformis TaxID=6319 RepID=A0AAN8F8H1_TRICO
MCIAIFLPQNTSAAALSVLSSHAASSALQHRRTEYHFWKSCGFKTSLLFANMLFASRPNFLTIASATTRKSSILCLERHRKRPLRGCPPPLFFLRIEKGSFLYSIKLLTGTGQGVILEAKDFFMPGPDHRELQCIPMPQDSDYITRTRGLDKNPLSVKDFVWVLSLRPTHKTLNRWDRDTVLGRARIPRSSALDSGYPYFFRVYEFVPVTPPLAHEAGSESCWR